MEGDPVIEFMCKRLIRNDAKKIHRDWHSNHGNAGKSMIRPGGYGSTIEFIIRFIVIIIILIDIIKFKIKIKAEFKFIT